MQDVTLKRAGDQLEVTWALRQPVPKSGLHGFYLFVASLDGSQAGQLGVKFSDGAQVDHFVFDTGSSQNVTLTSPVVVQANRVTASFPLTELSAYGNPFKWQATTTSGGADVDVCPDNPANDLVGPTERFAY